MKRRDSIQLFGNSILVEFGATGETGSITALPLDREIRIAYEDSCIVAYFAYGMTGLLVERFASETLGTSAHRDVLAGVRHYVRYARIRNCVKKLTLWVAVPIIAILFALSLNIAVTRGMGGAGALPVAAAPAPSPLQHQLETQQNNAPKVSAAEIARAMSDGVKAGKFSVRLSAENRPPLYIFSDPACSHCRKLEPELKKIGQDYTIHLFPVSVIGGQSSQTALGSLLW